jgi:hypothetical protein
MNTVEPPSVNSAQPPPLVNAGRIELVGSNDAVLARCQPGNQPIRIVLGE